MTDSDTPSIGFAGLGALGTAIAERLLDQSPELLVWNRTPGKAQTLKAKGALEAPTFADLCAGCDWLFACVSDDGALSQLIDRLLGQRKRPAIFISLTTASPDRVQEVASRLSAAGISFVNAPVIGRPDAVRAGSAGFLVAGEEAASRSVTEQLGQIGAQATYLGEKPQNAATMKLALNYFAAVIIGALSESFAMLRAQDIDPHLLQETLMRGPACSPLVGLFGEAVLAGKFEPALFKLSLAEKDMDYAEKAAGSSSRLLILDAVRRYMKASKDAGGSDLDWSGYAARALV